VPRKTTIVIADDHSLIRSALAELLNDVLEFEVTHEVGTADEALRAAATSSPSVIILDIGMPGTDAFQAAAEIRQISPNTEIIFLSGTLSDSTIDSARNSGARAYVVKTDPPEEVLSAVRAVVDGRTYFSPSVQARLPEVIGRARTDSRLASLSPRELETLRYIARGMAKKEIAPHMHISVKTVDKHVTQLMSKLDIHDRVELARFAIREGIIEL
jgi:DNA-binding NarL/FixJ family response regulator